MFVEIKNNFNVFNKLSHLWSYFQEHHLKILLEIFLKYELNERIK